MTQDDQQSPEVRRVGRKDQKKRLHSSGPLFPAEDKREPVEDAQFQPVPEAAAEPPPAEDLDVPEMFPEERYPPTLEDYEAQQAAEQQAAEQARREAARRQRRRANRKYNLGTALFLLLTIAMLTWLVLVWQNPYSELNPLAPPTPFVVVTQTPDLLALAAAQATATAANRGGAAPTDAVVMLPAADDVESSDAAEVIVGPTETPAPSPTPDTGGFPFTLTESGVIYVPNANDQGCDWSSIAGTVTDLNDNPLSGYAVQIVDARDETRLDQRVFSGSSRTYGEGGFELFLNGVPQEGQYIVQLFSPASVPLSEPIRIATRDTCDENVALVNFVQVEPL
jgi:hypothetical protein